MTRFSLLYLSGGPPLEDSERFRNRLSTFMGGAFPSTPSEAMALGALLELELGVEIEYDNISRPLGDFFTDAELRDVLDAITLIYDWLRKNKGDAARWKAFVARVLKEENVGYIVDDDCCVHPLVDEEFQANRSTTLRNLQDPKYGGVLGAFEDAFRHFDDDPQDTKAAVRSIYEALEILAKQLKPAPRLSEQLVNDLRKQYANRYDDQAARTTYNTLFDSMVRWVVGLQVYRHGQGVDKVIAPDEISCVHVLSAGTSYIRWLIDLQNKLPLSTTPSQPTDR